MSSELRPSVIGHDPVRTDFEGIVSPPTPEAVEHVAIPPDDAAPRVCHDGSSVDPPGGESAGPNDLQRLARFDRDEDKLVAGGRDTNRCEQGGGAARGHVRGFRREMQAHSARGQRRTREQRQNPQRDSSEDDYAGCGDRDASIAAARRRCALPWVPAIGQASPPCLARPDVIKTMWAWRTSSRRRPCSSRGYHLR